MNELPSLLITETNNAMGDQIEKGLTPASGRLSVDLAQNQLQWALAKGVSYEQAHEFAKSCGALEPAATDTDVKPKKKGLTKEEGALAKAMGFVLSVTDFDPGAEVSALLHGTHGEQFSTDADREVVDYLTTVEKIDLVTSPVHNPYAVQAGPQNGFPIARSMAVSAALDDLQKGGGFAKAPVAGAPVRRPTSGAAKAKARAKTANHADMEDGVTKGGVGSGPQEGGATRSRPENVSKVGFKYHTAPKQSANAGKDTMKEAEDAVRKQRASTAMAAFAKKSEADDEDLSAKAFA